MQQQHGFSSIEEETGNKNNNNPPGFKSIKKFDSNGNSLPVGVLKELVMVSFGFHTTLLLSLKKRRPPIYRSSKISFSAMLISPFYKSQSIRLIW
jgi:hypothetical protein